VVISGTAHEQVAGKLEAVFEGLGELRLKNLDRPVRAYRVVPGGGAAASPAPAPRGLPAGGERRPVVAVLPFTNMSDDPEQEHFADGLTEDLITALSAWRWFPVIGRHSTFAYKGRSPTIAQVAQELGARYVVEGSVRRAGNRVRIAAQLIDAATGHHAWAQRYDRELTDIFAVQDEITERMVTAIEPELGRAECRQASRKPPDNLDAWDLALRAQSHVHRFTAEDNREAFRLLEGALRLDPGSAFALGLLALCHYKDAILGFTDDRGRSLAETYGSAERAVALDGGDWLAHAMLGIARLWTQRDYDRALAEATRAAELNPSSTLARLFVSCVLEFGGRPAEAIPGLKAVLRLDPFSPLLSFAHADLAISHLLLRELEEAVAAAEEGIRFNPANVRARQRLAAALGHLGRTGEAQEALGELLRRQPDFSLGYVDSTYPFRLAEDRRFFLDGLRKAGWRG
jgi:TolB-like protein